MAKVHSMHLEDIKVDSKNLKGRHSHSNRKAIPEIMSNSFPWGAVKQSRS